MTKRLKQLGKIDLSSPAFENLPARSGVLIAEINTDRPPFAVTIPAERMPAVWAALGYPAQPDPVVAPPKQ